MSDGPITIPYKFQPRPYQLKLFQALDGGCKRAIAVYHRRAGKDKCLFNLIIKKAFERVGVYYYFFPEFSQGRRVIWDGIDGSGMKFRDHIPEELIAKETKQDMQITLVNGSILQIIGTDNYDKVRGSNPVGCVFSEFAFQNPMAWEIVRPILAENGGWAVFNSTPFGKNHFFQLYEMAKNNDEWFTQLITVEDSVDENGKRYVPQAVIDSEIAAGMSEEMAEQEFMCSFNANSQGFYYLKYMNDVEEDKRMGNIPWDPAVPVETWWDIGVGDSTAIWFTQIINKEIHVIDFYQMNSVGLDHYAKYIQNLPYTYKSHNFPHDMGNTEFGTGKTRFEVAEELFSGTELNIVPKIGIEDGINAARITLPRCWFDYRKCKEGIKALQNYHRQWDDKSQEFKNQPVHDWSSHPADAFRYLAVGMTMPKNGKSTTASRLKRFKRMSTKSWMVV